MDVNEVGTFISQFGFPTVLSGGLLWYINRQTKAQAERFDKLVNDIFKNNEKFINALNQNTNIIEQLKNNLTK